MEAINNGCFFESNSTYTNVVMNEELKKLLREMIEHEDFNIMKNDVYIKTIEAIQEGLRDYLIEYQNDITFKSKNYKLSLSNKCFPDMFVMALASITDTTYMTSFYDIFDLYREENRAKQGITITPSVEHTRIFEGLALCATKDNDKFVTTYCVCGHSVHKQNTWIVANEKTGKQILVGCDCIEKTMDKRNIILLRQQMKMCKNYNTICNTIKKQKEVKEVERKRIELLDATFRRCKECNAQTVLKNLPEWRTLCMGCFIEVKNPPAGKCLIKLNKAIKV